MDVKVTDYNVESEGLELSFFVGGELGTIVRTVSRDALSILLDKLAKKELPVDMPSTDVDLVKQVEKQGGISWIDLEINKMEKF